MPADLVTRLLLQNKEFDRNIQESRRQIQAFEKRVNAMGATVRSFVAGFAGMAGVSMAFMDMTQKSMLFEKSLSSLRALTGVSADEMEFFKQQAIKMGSTSSQTASQVVDAFKLIGSQKPELLKNKEALSEVTRQAIILAEAAGMDVPEAAKALTGSLNQMGESARKAGEYVNILAAASQAGSADIPYLTKAIEKSGGAASSVGVNYNELVAAIEAIAPKMSEASEAGTNLRNIFLTLESNADKKLKPSVVGLTKALENLAAKNLDATQMTKMFGKESVTAALAIVNAKDNYLHYKDAITGTNTALEQQKINNDNLAGSINALSSSWEGFVLTLNQSGGALRTTIDLLSTILGGITEAVKSEEERQIDIIESAASRQKKALDREIESWQKYGLDKKQAVEKVLESYPRNYEIPDDALLKKEEDKLKILETRYANLKKQNLEINPFGAVGALNSTIIPDIDGKVDFNPNTQPATTRLKDELAAQKEIVNQLRVKNAVYDQSVKYLQEELDATNKVKEASGKGATGVTDDMRKGWKKLDAKEKRELSFEEFSDNQAILIRKELKEKLHLDKPLSLEIEPTIDYNNPEDAQRVAASMSKRLEYLKTIYAQKYYTFGDVKENKELGIAGEEGEKVALTAQDEENIKHYIELYKKRIAELYSKVKVQTEEDKENLPIANVLTSELQSVEDYQKKIQDTTLLYNQATSDGLRAIYAQQLEDLEEHLQKMTDVNQGMVDIAQEVNSLVQGSVVSAFESIGDAIASNDAGDAMRNMLMGIMDMLKQFGAALVSAGLASVAFKKLLANPYLAIAAGGALIIASTAAKAALQKSISAGSYADSGIVPYRFTVGDRMTANVNGGEMILNTTKQKKLFDLLDIGRTQINNDAIRVSGRLVGSGDQIVAVLDSVAKKQRRGL